MVTILVAAGVTALCGGLRALLRDRPAGRQGGWVRFRPLWNRGAAFGLPVEKRTLTALSAGTLAVLWSWRRRSPVGVGLVLGGGVSNLWERLRHGRVFDYLQFPKAPGALRRYVYNLADLAILAGAVTLLLRKGRRRPPGKQGGIR